MTVPVCTATLWPLAWLDLCRHAEAVFPNEACGLLVGHVSPEGEAVVQHARPARNMLCSPDQFELDPRDRVAVQRQLRETSPESWILGHYHSHPGASAEPSPRDRARAEEEGMLWLIVSVERGSVQGVSAHVSQTGSRLVPVALSWVDEKKAQVEKKVLHDP